jgi:dipeptidyl aminopeptidase/acylaminoacyl peptidase
MHCWAFFRRLTWAALFAAFPSAFAATPAMTPAQALSFVRASDLHFSPDGAKLAYVVTSYRWDAKPHVRIMDVATGAEREITPAGKSERSPQWSPDGAKLGFLSNRGGATQVWVASADGGEAMAVTERKFGVEAFHWRPDARAIAYLAKDDRARPEDEGPQLADREEDLPRLWVVDLDAKASRSLARTGWRIDEFQWRDGTHILAAATDTPRVEAFTDAIYSFSTGDDGVELVAAPPQPFDTLLHPQRADADADLRRGGRPEQSRRPVQGSLPCAQALRRRDRIGSLSRRRSRPAEGRLQRRHVPTDTRLV